MDNITPNATNQQNGLNPPIGCSSICVNQPDCVSLSQIIQNDSAERNNIKIFSNIANPRTYRRCSSRIIESLLHRISSYNRTLSTRKIQSID